MASYAGRDLLLKISDGGTPPIFTSLGVARAIAFDVLTSPADVTPLGASISAQYSADAGRQDARITLQGIFKDDTAEAQLRAAALAGVICRYQLVFANGDTYEADFIAEAYRREGAYDGLEAFAVTLLRSGEGTWTAA